MTGEDLVYADTLCIFGSDIAPPEIAAQIEALLVPLRVASEASHDARPGDVAGPQTA